MIGVSGGGRVEGCTGLFTSLPVSAVKGCTGLLISPSVPAENGCAGVGGPLLAVGTDCNDGSLLACASP